MSSQNQLEKEVRKTIKKNRWLILSTSSPKGLPQNSLVVYASDGYKIIVLTGKKIQKVKNLSRNPLASITIPFYKNLLHRMIVIAPPASISLKANVEIIDFSDEETLSFYQKVLNFKLPSVVMDDSVWLKLTLGKTATCHGIGVKLFELRDPEKAHKIVQLTNR
jgi:general stress protein 26